MSTGGLVTGGGRGYDESMISVLHGLEDNLNKLIQEQKLTTSSLFLCASGLLEAAL